MARCAQPGARSPRWSLRCRPPLPSEPEQDSAAARAYRPFPPLQHTTYVDHDLHEVATASSVEIAGTSTGATSVVLRGMEDPSEFKLPLPSEFSRFATLRCVAVPWDGRHKLSDDLIETGVGEIAAQLGDRLDLPRLHHASLRTDSAQDLHSSFDFRTDQGPQQRLSALRVGRALR
jgi:hypothetical protein